MAEEEEDAAEWGVTHRPVSGAVSTGQKAEANCKDQRDVLPASFQSFQISLWSGERKVR